MKHIKLFEEWNLLDEGYSGRPADFQFADFEKARKFAQTLGLKGESDWRIFSKSAKLPYDIPADPYTYYKKRGVWTSWGDFLGTGTVSSHLKQFKPFEEAREFARTLGLKGMLDWKEYCISGDKPHDIPTNPNIVYADKGWSGFGDFLGTGNIAMHLKQFRPFEEAREFARSLGLKNEKEWRKYCTSGQNPDDIPSAPNIIYAEKGWMGWGDFLGTGKVATYLREYKPFEEAREFVRTLGLKGENEWRKYCTSGEKPDDIPSAPSKVYAEKGWMSWGDFLGTGKVATSLREYKSFEEAREFVRSLGLKSIGEWRKYCTSGEKPDDIPTNPNREYAGKGWISMGDFLGTGIVATYLREYRPFEEAREFARSLGLKSETEWRKYCTSGEKPDDIPSAPSKVYADKGWAGFGDFLGTGNVPSRMKYFIPFDKEKSGNVDSELENETEI